MVREQEVRDLLRQTRRFKKLAETHEDERIVDINESIWNCIIDILQADDKERCYEIFAAYEVNHYDIDTTIGKLKSLKSA